MRIVIAGALAAILSIAPAAHAGIENAGTTAANFLSVGAGAGIVGMGGATLGSGNDLNAASWNPAALGRLNQMELVFSHAGLAEQSAQEWASVGGRFGASRIRWAANGLFQSEGTFEGRDASNNPTGTFDVSSSALGVQVASPFGPFVTAGLGVKMASENLGGVNGAGVTFDAGLSVHSGPLGVGIAAQNLGGQMKYDAASYPFPTNIGAGVSLALPASGMRFAVDANFPSAYYSDVRGGVEWKWLDRFALRTGYRAEIKSTANEPLNGPTFGMGAGVSGVWLDYGYLLGGNGNGQHRVGLSFHPAVMGWGMGGRDESPIGARAIEPPAKPAPVKPTATSSQPGTTPPAKQALTSQDDATKPVTPTAMPKPVLPTSESPRSTTYPSVPTRAPVTITPPASAPTKPPVTIMPPGPPVPTTPVAPKPAAPASKPVATTLVPSAPVEPVKPTVATTPKSSASPVPSVPMMAPPKPPVTSPATSVPMIAPPKPTVASPVPSAPTVAAPKPVAPTPPASAPAIVTPKPATQPVVAPKAAVEAPQAPVVAPKIEAAPKVEAAPKNDSAPASQERSRVFAQQPAAPATPATPAPTPATPPASVTLPAEPKPAPVVKEAPAPAASKPVARPAKVSVKKGETLESIAKQWGTSPAAIMMENNLVKDTVKPGQSLKLPKR